MTFNAPDIALSLSSPGQVLAEIGKRARGERFRRGLTQAELAAASGVARRTISRLEAGEPVGTDILVLVAFALRSERGVNQCLRRRMLVRSTRCSSLIRVARNMYVFGARVDDFTSRARAAFLAVL